MTELLALVLPLLTDILALGGIDPQPEAPPGSEGLLTLLNWVLWIVAVICLLAFIGSAGWLAYSVFNGQSTRVGSGMIIIIFAAVIVGSASTILAIFL